MEVRSDRWYDFAAPRRRVWEALSCPQRFRGWWPWLHELRAEALAPGERWDCVVSPPLPYVVRFSLDLLEVEPGRTVRASVVGDLTGSAHLELVDDGPDATRLHLVSALAPAHPALRVVAGAARPLVRHGHDWVLDTGARQFAEQAL